MLLSVAIVSYNTELLTLQTLRSLEADVLASALLKNLTEVIVVDNNSSDTSVTALRHYKKESKLPITIIENEKNVGFSRANNQAIKISQGKYVLLLNSDTIVEPGATEALVQAFEDMPEDASSAEISSEHGKLDHLGILAARLKNADGSVQPQGGSAPTLTSLFFHMSFLDDLPIIGHWLPSTQHTGNRFDRRSEKRLLTPKDWVGGTAMMIRRETLDEIGLLDEHIFMYGEDIELCMRAQAHHWDVAIHNGAWITHLQNKSGSSEKALRGELLSYLYIWSKLKPLWQLPLVRSILMTGIVLRIIIFSALGRVDKAKTYYKILTAVRTDAA